VPKRWHDGSSPNLTVFSAPAVLTMSSREIAELTGKMHKNVLEDIRKMLDGLGQTSAECSANLPDAYGRLQQVFLLPKRETMILVSGYSVVVRARIIDRWMELQEAAAICLEVKQIGPLVSARADWSDAPGIIYTVQKIP